MKKSNVTNAILLSLVAASMVACSDSKSKKKAAPEAPVVEAQVEDGTPIVEAEYQHPAFSMNMKDSLNKVQQLNTGIKVSKNMYKDEEAQLEDFSEKSEDILNKSEGIEEYKVAMDQVRKHESAMQEQVQKIADFTTQRRIYKGRIGVLKQQDKVASAKKALMQSQINGDKDKEVSYEKSIAASVALIESYTNHIK